MEIHASLRTLLENRTPLLVRFTERNQRYRTFLVEVNQEKGWLALDELIPSDGDRLIAAGESFQIEGFNEGVRLAWTHDQQTHVGELDGAPCYWTPLPETLTYHQRRNAYRAQLSGPTVDVKLTGKMLLAAQGKLLDMSATGCKISFKGDLRDRLQTGEIYAELSAKLPFGTIVTAVELRHAIYDENIDITFCGLRFYNISGLAQRQIERFVYQLQREVRRDQTQGRFS